MHKSLFFATLLLVATGLSGCKAGKNLSGPRADRSVRTLLAEAEKQRLEFHTLNLQGKAEIKIPDQRFDMSVNYRASILSDSLIVVRFSKFGLEAIRIQVRPDSITIVNKTNNTYMVAGYGLAEQFTGIRPDFRMVQDVLLGNLYIAPDNPQPRKLPNKDWELTGEKNGTGFIYEIDDLTLKPLWIQTANSARNQASSVRYGDFRPAANAVLPQSVKVELAAPWVFSAALSHSKVEVNPTNPVFSFEIPPGYTREKIE